MGLVARSNRVLQYVLGNLCDAYFWCDSDPKFIIGQCQSLNRVFMEHKVKTRYLVVLYPEEQPVSGVSLSEHQLIAFPADRIDCRCKATLTNNSFEFKPHQLLFDLLVKHFNFESWFKLAKDYHISELTEKRLEEVMNDYLEKHNSYFRLERVPIELGYKLIDPEGNFEGDNVKPVVKWCQS